MIPRYYLLNPDDVHVLGDEMWNSVRMQWEPVAALHFGDVVGDDPNPCRRLLTPGGLQRLIKP